MKTLYKKMGGEEPLKQLVETFYDIIERNINGKIIHDLHLKGHGITILVMLNLNFYQVFLADLNTISSAMVIPICA